MSKGQAWDDLRNWIAENRPQLAAELGPLPLLTALDVLNRETGLNVQPGEHIETTAARFLAVLVHNHAMKEVVT